MTAAAQATPSRAEISRKNGQKSKGPITDAGKDRVKFNALKHGMRAKTIVLPGEDVAAFRARHDAWTIDLDPRDEIERFLVTRAVEVSWKLDRIGRAIEGRRATVRDADADRLAAEAEEVVALGRRLFFDPVGPLCLYPHAASPAGGEVRRVSYSGVADDPDDPARIVVRLEAMMLGCAWLLDRWGDLRELLECGLPWQPHDRLKAVRMLGRQPLDAPDDKRVMIVYLCGWAMDPNDQHGFSDMVNEFGPGERKTFVERLNNRDAMDAMPPNEEAARAMLLALIAEEEERLDGILADHLERAEAEATSALAFDATAYGERLRRYEADSERTLLRIVETLRKRHREADAAGSAGGRASRRAESDPVGPAVRPPVESANDRTQDDSLHAVPPSVDAPATTAEDTRMPGTAPCPSANESGGFPLLDTDPTDGLDPQPPDPHSSDNRIDPTSRPSSSLGLLAGAVLALFALIVFAGRSPVVATLSPIGGRSPSTMSTDAPASVSWVRSFKPTSCEPQRNSLRRKGNGPDRPGGGVAASRSARPA